MLFMNHRLVSFAIATAAFPIVTHQAFAEDNDPAVVDHVDLARYMGRWYEIAAFPQPFEQDCFGTQANYSLNGNGTVRVVNSCNKGSFTGDLESATATGRDVDPVTHAKLKIRFPMAEGDYWILELADDYTWALVGTPERDALWILSREPVLSDAIYNQLIQQGDGLGYDVSKLVKTPQQASH